MATDDATFRVVLDDQISGPAETAAERMERLKGSIERGRRELSGLQKAMRDMKRSGSVSAEVLATHQKKIDDLSSRLGKANAEYLELGGTFQKTKPPTKGTQSLADALQKLGVNTGGPLARMKDLGGFFKSAAGRALIMKAAIFALAVGLVALTAKLTKYSIAQANAAREERLRFETLAHLRGRSKTAIADAEGMQEAIDRVSGAYGAARSEVSGYAEAAYRAGFRGKALEETIRGAAARGSALGERYGKSFVFMAASASRAGKDISKMADDAEKRFGGLAQRRLMSTGNLARRLRENFSGLFSGVKIEPLLKSLSRFVQLFSKSNEVGREAESWITPFFSGIVDGMAKVVDGATWFVETTTLYWVRFQNVIKSGVVAVIEGLFWLEDRFNDFKSAVSNFELPSWAQKAVDVAKGLVLGFGAEERRVKTAGGKLADAAAKGFRDRAQIKSPSRLFASYGDDVSEGFAIGVRRSTPEAHEAIGDLAAAPEFPAASVPEASSVLGGGVVINVGDIIYQGGGATGEVDEGFLESLRLRVAEILEGAALQAGLT